MLLCRNNPRRTGRYSSVGSRHQYRYKVRCLYIFLVCKSRVWNPDEIWNITPFQRRIYIRIIPYDFVVFALSFSKGFLFFLLQNQNVRLHKKPLITRYFNHYGPGLASTRLTVFIWLFRVTYVCFLFSFSQLVQNIYVSHVFYVLAPIVFTKLVKYCKDIVSPSNFLIEFNKQMSYFYKLSL